jgi:hypothetical protein
VTRRKIDEKKAEDVLTRSLAESETRVSLRRFIRDHFEVIAGSGKTIKSVYESLRANGIDVGSYSVFGSVYSQVKRARRQAGMPQNPLDRPRGKGEKKGEREARKSGDDGREQTKRGSEKSGPALPPVYLADGTEVEITETGAKVFQIEHSPTWKKHEVSE